MKATLIISVYKDVEALRAVLRSVAAQTERNFEVIVSQDCEDPCFDGLLEEFSRGLAITHLQQPDNGFLKNSMLNRCIRTAKTDKLIFIDGDCVLHRRFVEQFERLIERGVFCAGRRVDLDERTSRKIRNGEEVTPGFFEMIANKTVRVEDGFFLPKFMRKKMPRLIGCNMGWHKADLVMLNGFDETYTNPGFGEDTDIEFRAKKAGLRPYSTRFRTIQYHLAHERPDREDAVLLSRKLFEERKKRADFRCRFGLETLPE